MTEPTGQGGPASRSTAAERSSDRRDIGIARFFSRDRSDISRTSICRSQRAPCRRFPESRFARVSRYYRQDPTSGTWARYVADANAKEYEAETRTRCSRPGVKTRKKARERRKHGSRRRRSAVESTARGR